MTSSCLPFNKHQLSKRNKHPMRTNSLCTNRPDSELSDMNVLHYIHLATFDPNIQKVLERDLKIRDAASRILNISHNWSQRLDAGKTLLVTNTRIMACMREIQKENQRRADEERRLQNQETSSMKSDYEEKVTSSVCRSKLCISDIRIPLMWKDGCRVQPDYHVFCLLKIGSDIQDTQLVSEIGPNNYDVEFKDVLVFKDVPHDFQINIEIYGFKCKRSVQTVASKRLSGMMFDENSPKLINPDFELLGKTSLNLSQISEKILSHEINTIAVGDASPRYVDLPLFGNLCCRMVAQPSSILHPVSSGYVKIKEESSQMECLYYCELQDRRLNCWLLNSTDSSKDLAANTLSKPSVNEIPDLIVPIIKTSTFLNDSSDNGHALQVSTFLDEDYRDQTFYKITFLTAEDYNHWWKCFHQHVSDQVHWGSAYENIEFQEPTSFVRQGSIIRASTILMNENVF